MTQIPDLSQYKDRIQQPICKIMYFSKRVTTERFSDSHLALSPMFQVAVWQVSPYGDLVLTQLLSTRYITRKCDHDHVSLIFTALHSSWSDLTTSYFMVSPLAVLIYVLDSRKEPRDNLQLGSSHSVQFIIVFHQLNVSEFACLSIITFWSRSFQITGRIWIRS